MAVAQLSVLGLQHFPMELCAIVRMRLNSHICIIYKGKYLQCWLGIRPRSYAFKQHFHRQTSNQFSHSTPVQDYYIIRVPNSIIYARPTLNPHNVMNSVIELGEGRTQVDGVYSLQFLNILFLLGSYFH